MSTSFPLSIYYRSFRNYWTVYTVHFRCDQMLRTLFHTHTKVEKFVTVFSASVWLTMTIVFTLTSALMWFSANYSDWMFEKESKTLHIMQGCMYIAWSIFIGVSVPEMPRSWKLRIFFLIYVCYCFAMSTVLKDFFISCFVETDMRRNFEHSKNC